MIKVFLVPHLLIEDDQFPLNLSPLSELRVELIFDFRDLNLLKCRGVLLELLRNFLLDLNLLLNLQSVSNMFITIFLSVSSLVLAFWRCLRSMLLKRLFLLTGVVVVSGTPA